jgi:hypothetical protein
VKRFTRDYKLSLSYSGSSILSADNGLLHAVSGLPVNNKSNGLPVHITSGTISADGITLSLVFSKPMALSSAQLAYFALDVSGGRVGFKSYSVSGNTIQLILSKAFILAMPLY